MPSTFNTLCDEATLYAAWNQIRTKGASGGIDAGVKYRGWPKN